MNPPASTTMNMENETLLVDANNIHIKMEEEEDSKGDAIDSDGNGVAAATSTIRRKRMTRSSSHKRSESFRIRRTNNGRNLSRSNSFRISQSPTRSFNSSSRSRMNLESSLSSLPSASTANSFNNYGRKNRISNQLKPTNSFSSRNTARTAETSLASSLQSITTRSSSSEDNDDDDNEDEISIASITVPSSRDVAPVPPPPPPPSAVVGSPSPRSGRSWKRLQTIHALSEWQKQNRSDSNLNFIGERSPPTRQLSFKNKKILDHEGDKEMSLQNKLFAAYEVIEQQREQIKSLLDKKRQRKMNDRKKKDSNNGVFISGVEEEKKTEEEVSEALDVNNKLSERSDQQRKVRLLEQLAKSNQEKDTTIKELKSQVLKLEKDLLLASSRPSPAPSPSFSVPNVTMNEQQQKLPQSQRLPTVGEDQANFLKDVMDKQKKKQPFWRLRHLGGGGGGDQYETINNNSTHGTTSSSSPTPGGGGTTGTTMIDRLTAENEMLWRQVYSMQQHQQKQKLGTTHKKIDTITTDTLPSSS